MDGDLQQFNGAPYQYPETKSRQDKRFFKYLTINEEDKDWGVFISGAGHIGVDKNTTYPLINDPEHHYFHYSEGRRLSDYQIIYITTGKGVFESELSGKITVKEGDVFVLFPNVWHRFKPDEKTGWDEYWVEFNGDMVKRFQLQQYLDPKHPVVTIGIFREIVSNFIKIIQLIRNEKPGFQYISSGILMQLIGQLIAAIKYQPLEGKAIESKIKQAKLKMFENIGNFIAQEELAESLGIGYSLYRKKFKEYTGLSPAQYHIQMKIKVAKDLLITTNLSIKEVAYKLNFSNIDYFFRLFKMKTGFTPSDYREKNWRWL